MHDRGRHIGINGPKNCGVADCACSQYREDSSPSVTGSLNDDKSPGPYTTEQITDAVRRVFFHRNACSCEMCSAWTEQFREKLAKRAAEKLLHPVLFNKTVEEHETDIVLGLEAQNKNLQLRLDGMVRDYQREKETSDRLRLEKLRNVSTIEDIQDVNANLRKENAILREEAAKHATTNPNWVPRARHDEWMKRALAAETETRRWTTRVSELERRLEAVARAIEPKP